ncbi:unnamed protein product [Sphagnum jensenii]|uniref:CSD domain-containing protein n=1 Tax=Sphagnum jensenii TaxID=128206 RepID=A0ABP0V939_9BRYO
MPKGRVKFYDIGEKFGFIEPEEGGQDVFLPSTALQDAGLDFLGQGQQVSYDLTEDKGKIVAQNIKLLTS